MDWPLILAAFVIGLILGYVGRTLLNRNQDCKHTNEELEQSKLELSQHKQDVADSFSQQKKLLSSLNEQMNKVNQHWNDTNKNLLDKPFSPLPTSALEVIENDPQINLSEAQETTSETTEKAS